MDIRYQRWNLFVCFVFDNSYSYWFSRDGYSWEKIGFWI